MRPNKIKQMWRDGKCVTLGWLSVSHGFTAEVMARQGFDALCVDMQHGTTAMNDVCEISSSAGSRPTARQARASASCLVLNAAVLRACCSAVIPTSSTPGNPSTLKKKGYSGAINPPFS